MAGIRQWHTAGKGSTTKSTKDAKVEFGLLPHRVIGCAIEDHRVLRPGLLESTREQCLARGLKLAGINTGANDSSPDPDPFVLFVSFVVSAPWRPAGR